MSPHPQSIAKSQPLAFYVQAHWDDRWFNELDEGDRPIRRTLRDAKRLAQLQARFYPVFFRVIDRNGDVVAEY